MPVNVHREEVQRLIHQGAQLVEVLSPREYEAQHIPGAVNLPLRDLSRETAARLDPGRPVIVYCRDAQ